LSLTPKDRSILKSPLFKEALKSALLALDEKYVYARYRAILAEAVKALVCTKETSQDCCVASILEKLYSTKHYIPVDDRRFLKQVLTPFVETLSPSSTPTSQSLPSTPTSQTSSLTPTCETSSSMPSSQIEISSSGSSTAYGEYLVDALQRLKLDRPDDSDCYYACVFGAVSKELGEILVKTGAHTWYISKKDELLYVEGERDIEDFKKAFCDLWGNCSPYSAQQVLNIINYQQSSKKCFKEESYQQGDAYENGTIGGFVHAGNDLYVLLAEHTIKHKQFCYDNQKMLGNDIVLLKTDPNVQHGTLFWTFLKGLKYTKLALQLVSL